MLHDLIPSNHYYSYHQTNKHNPDFYKRNEIYHGYTRPLLPDRLIGHASQFIAIIPEGLSKFEYLKKLVYHLVPDISIIRATSPLDDKTIWMEIFPQSVSKGKTAEWLCKKLSINQENTLALGNDYNDIDLLNFCKWSFLVENAPIDLKNKYPVTLSNCNNGFSNLMNKYFSFIALDL
jgi:hydroxymethylpyrimidine pyrophosphatase-like HAD family hydrolase